MKIYNPFKKIRELEKELKRKNDNLAELSEKLHENKHKPDVYCDGCKHLTTGTEIWGFTEHTVKYCLLDGVCKDRTEG